MPISLVKRGTISKSRIKELHTFEGLGRKKVRKELLLEIFVIGLKVLKLVILLLILKIRRFKND
jgi:hypothetical protein